MVGIDKEVSGVCVQNGAKTQTSWRQRGWEAWPGAPSTDRKLLPSRLGLGIYMET